MRLRFVHLHGFRGYRKPVRIDFAESFTIIDGRNGVGKSTIFDAVEFALTGTISKYLDAKADGESVTDYIWWTGPNGPEGNLSDHFVEVGFGDESDSFEIRRTPLDPTNFDLRSRVEKLYLPDAAPREAIAQLCNSTIIRDEHIARLSLDLKEGERFRLLRDAIGAVDADDWIKRAQAIHSAASAKLKTAQADAEAATSAQAAAIRRIDEAHASLPAADLVAQASERLRRVLDATATSSALVEMARQRIAEIGLSIEKLQRLIDGFAGYDAARTALPMSEERVSGASVKHTLAQITFDESVAALGDATVATTLSEQARQLENLVEIGRTLGRRDGHCPLCASDVSHEAFHRGLDQAISIARMLDAQAVDQARKERERDAAFAALQTAEREVSVANVERGRLAGIVNDFERILADSDLAGASRSDVELRLGRLNGDQQAIAADMRMLDTLSFDRVISRVRTEQATATEQVRQTELRLGRARLGESRSKALYDAARRASAETLQQRLDRVIPLMSELYRRLRPHPLWGDIEYSVRGDVNRFLTLKVDGDVNPQFVFSSGQRRATGLAFLLSVNLSIAWSRWQSILLDDPVQHVDDFRTVHLAEVLAQLCSSGRQIVCAVEDRALADLMCRRLPSSVTSPGKRISLGTDASGALAVVHEQTIATLSRRALVLPSEPLSA